MPNPGHRHRRLWKAVGITIFLMCSLYYFNFVYKLELKKEYQIKVVRCLVAYATTGDSASIRLAGVLHAFTLPGEGSALGSLLLIPL